VIGFSWGAWLSVLLAARSPALVSKLILVSSGPFEPHYARGLQDKRLSRLSTAERQEALALLAILDDPTADRDSALARVGRMFSRVDSFDPLPWEAEDEGLPVNYTIHRAVWREASELRASGELLRIAGRIQCPVVALHGDHDPHPAAGVREPLSRVVSEFRFVLLQKCGHRPWLERQARDRFFALVRQELEEMRGTEGASSTGRRSDTPFSPSVLADGEVAPG
jgi:pimeloyl-ACP methyl ester carboxylesterase